MKTVLEEIYNMFEQHDERVFLDFMRENKKFLFEKEQKQMTQTQVVEKPIDEKLKSSFSVKTV
jgi:hypothetical protein